ncbi:MAG TPA: lysophospholipid acyltransferase family protein [Pseudonocardiaceae bacterium]|nr:lysophospholipid acyltransferase family protein [Pseudonocardiaceae bacterium]
MTAYDPTHYPPQAARGWVALSRWIATWLYHVPYRLHRTGLDNTPATGPLVVVVNHSTFAEGPLVLGALPRGPVFLIKRELFVGPVGWVLRKMGQLALRRDAPDRVPLMEAQRILRAGGVIGIFPEGTRGEGQMTNAENGAAWLATSTGAAVLPVACRGTYRVPGARRRYRPRVDILVGKPLTLPHQRGRAAVTAATEQIRVALADLVVELDEVRGAKIPEQRE